MKIAIIGLGYVGITSAAGFLELGFEVVGYENNVSKVNALREGTFPIVEDGVSDLFKKNAERFSVFSEPNLVLNTCDYIMIAVGTPTSKEGVTSLIAMDSVLSSLSSVIETNSPILIRSTVPIGTSRVYSERYPHLNIVFHPEFLREGSAIEDFFKPPKIVFGVRNNHDGGVPDPLSRIYDRFNCEIYCVAYESAESVKYADNIFHALKVAFTNEIVKAVTKKGANPYDVMSIFRSDRQLNISPVYLNPGFAYGGSCLEKDLFSFREQLSGCSLPLLDAITVSNEGIIRDAYLKIKDAGRNFIVNGLTFKEGVDDLRRSPYVSLVKMLLNDGSTVYAFDDNLHNLFGESFEILNELREFPGFRLNERVDLQAGEVVVVFCHRERHSLLGTSYVSDFDLYTGGAVSKVYL
jgi:GDP-mannose 6-dehydrogenase